MSALYPPAPFSKQSRQSPSAPWIIPAVTATFHLPQLAAALSAVWKFKVHPSEPKSAENIAGFWLTNSGHCESGHKSPGADMLFFLLHFFFFPVLQQNVLTHLKCCIKYRCFSPRLVLFLGMVSIYTMTFRRKQLTCKFLGLVWGSLGYKCFIFAPKCTCHQQNY